MNSDIEKSKPGEETDDMLTLSDKDIRIIGSTICFIIFLVSIIYELSHPSSLWATVLMFSSILAFVMIVFADRD